MIKTDTIKLYMIAIIYALYSILTRYSNVSIVLLGCTALFALFSAYTTKGKLYVKIEEFQLFVLAFALYSIASAIWATNPSDSVEKGVTIIEILICTSLFYWNYRFDENAVYKLLKVTMIGGYIIMAYSYWYYGINTIITTILTSSRLQNGFDIVNVVGILVGISVIISVFFFMEEKRTIQSTISLALSVPSIVLIIATGSRKAILLVFLGIMVSFGLRAYKRDKSLLVFKLLIAIVVFIFLLKFLSQLSILSGVTDRFRDLLSFLSNDSSSMDHSDILRKMMIKQGLELFASHPLGGVGMGNAHIYWAAISGDDSFLHNNFVELLANGGLIGFILYYLMYIYSLKKCITAFLRDKDNIGIMVITLIICLLVMDYGSVSYYSKSTYFYLMIVFLYIKQFDERKKNNEYNIC